MVNLALGILIGVAGTLLAQKARTTKKVTWYAWVLFVLAAAAIVFGFDVLTGSFIEHEVQAAWMGLGFSLVLAILLFIAGWRWGVKEKA